MKKRRFLPKRLADGRALLNCACGTVMHPGWTNIDFSPYAWLGRRRWLGRLLWATGLLSPDRWERLQRVDPQVIYWDLRRGIPFGDETFDAVYHCHFLEHLPRAAAARFLAECYRVLVPGGVLRVAVPDLEAIIDSYCQAVRRLDLGDAPAAEDHRQAIHRLFDQMVRSELAGTERQRPVLRWVERRLRGNAVRNGELHYWMYDRFSLEEMLVEAGFSQIARCGQEQSAIAGFTSCALEIGPSGRPYHPHSLYMEGTKSPAASRFRIDRHSGVPMTAVR